MRQMMQRTGEFFLKPLEARRGPFRFLPDERGQVLVEYVLLVVGIFIAVNVTIAPLKQALLVFAADVVRHLQAP